MTTTLDATLDRVASTRGAARAICSAGVTLTYQDVLAGSHAISGVLDSLGIAPGQRVALLLPNSAAFVTAFLGAVRTGAVVAPLNPQYRSQELTYYLADLDPAAVLADPRALPTLTDVTSVLPRAPAIVEISARVQPVVRRRGIGRAAAITVAGTPLLQQYTSGSTGTPKRVVRTHANLLTELEALRTVFGVDERDRFLAATPFCHVNGLVRTMLTALYVGAALYPVEQFKRREVLDLLTREALTFFGGVPYMFAMLGQTPSHGAVDLSRLRLVFSSSAPLMPRDAVRFLERFGVGVRQLYGSTETGTISFDGTGRGTSGTVGTPLPGVAVEVVDDDRPLGPGQEGELAVASPFAATGYLGNQTATGQSFRDGRYFTGDLGRRDRTGALTLTARKAWLINRGGLKVNPHEVEHALREHPNVVDVAVVGAPGVAGDDVVQAFIVVSAATSVEEILDHCRPRIAAYKIPVRIEFVEALPTGPTGKVLRSLL